MKTFDMPSLGADMESGTLIEWLVKPGDQVNNGDVVAVVETHKGAIEIEIFEDATIESLLLKEGESVPVGTPMAQLAAAGSSDETAPHAPEAAEETAQAQAQAEPIEPEPIEPEPTEPDEAVTERPASAPSTAPPLQEQPPDAAVPTTDSDRAAASPAARRRAAELGIELLPGSGSGPGGAILLADVERQASEARPAPDSAAAPRASAKAGLDMAAMRQTIAAAMSRSKREIPHFYLSRDIDLQAASDWLQKHNDTHPPEQRLLMMALLLRATILALGAVPTFNGQYVDGNFQPSEAVNAGVAVALRGGGLIAPAILNAGAMSLSQLMAAMRELVTRTRSGRLKQSEMTRGTITVSSLGDDSADLLYGVIYPPQVALIGFGSPRLRAWLVDGELCSRNIITATLAADHRVSDGREGARLLTEIEARLQQPEQL